MTRRIAAGHLSQLIMGARIRPERRRGIMEAGVGGLEEKE